MLKRAAALRPNYSKIHFRLAMAYAHLGKKKEAQQEALLQKSERDDEDTGIERRRGGPVRAAKQ